MNDTLVIAEKVRERRTAADFSQAEMVDLLKALGVPISRSHYANLESGRFPFQPAHCAVLDAILGIDGFGFGPASGAGDKLPGRWQHSEVPKELADWDRFISAVSDHSEPSDRIVSTAWMERGRDTEVFKDPKDLRVLTIRVIREAIAAASSSGSRPQQAGRIFLVGLPGLEPNAASSALAELRAVLVDAMYAGYVVEHVVPRQGPDHRGHLLKIVGSLLACGQYRSYEGVGGAAAALSPEFLVVQGAHPAAVQYLRDPASPAAAASAILVRNPDWCEALAGHVRSLVAPLEPLAKTVVRRDERWRHEPNERDYAFYQLLTQNCDVGSWVDYSIGWLPSALLPPHVMEPRFHERAQRIDDPMWQTLGILHRQRHEALLAMLKRGVHVRVLLATDRLQAFRDHGSHHAARQEPEEVAEWRRFPEPDRDEAIRFLIALKEHPDHKSALEINLIDNPAKSKAIDQSRFEARGGRDGFVFLQTPAQDHDRESGATVSILMRSRLVVAGFHLRFERHLAHIPDRHRDWGQVKAALLGESSVSIV